MHHRGEYGGSPLSLPPGVQWTPSRFFHLPLQRRTRHTHTNSSHNPSCDEDGPALFELQTEKITRRKRPSLFKQCVMIHFNGSEFPDQVPKQVIFSLSFFHLWIEIQQNQFSTLKLCTGFLSDGVPLDITCHVSEDLF